MPTHIARSETGSGAPGLAPPHPAAAALSRSEWISTVQLSRRCISFWSGNECPLKVHCWGALKVYCTFFSVFFFFFPFVLVFIFIFIFAFDKTTELGTFLIGFTIFIFKLCFSHLICTDSLLSSFFSMFVLICKNMHLKTTSFQYFYNSLVVFCILCTPTKENFYARSCV